MSQFRTVRKNDGGGDYLVIHQPNQLRQKVGRISVDPQALERAEAALRTIAASYPAELARNARAAQTAWDEWKVALDSDELRNRLVVVVHDIKGQAGSLGYPLATEVARSLGIVLRNDAAKLATLRPVIDAHIGALNAIAAQAITDDGGKIGADLIAGLRLTLEKFGLDPNDGLTA